MLLRPEHRTKQDPSNDNDFYAAPRFVTHVDAGFIDQLTELYKEKLKPNSRVLDLMSSWVSHLPDEIEFDHVEGHGMNREELAKNPGLDSYFVQNLNHNPKLPLNNEDFDAVLITVSVQYLQYPEAIFAEIYRILKPGGIVIVSFSNRMFFQKAIAIWRDNSEAGRVELVKKYFQAIPGFSTAETVINQPPIPGFLQLLGMAGSDPFYAVMATKEG
ncbi:Methylase involved in ubiquinone/menaquinone biosynthesis [Hyella patelloides LEGE 07179]|uniref:Methylase involved in ubiquinone/menaquinone biosynthesis n=1 Tax=Hyella patelloides LEGE 07179 TaxID=945734 RepID=A0A563VYA9_9CYAN|nr:class I SAM-dependent methyltransferase [Hyella patelloides]VEP16385.1 Methylase involved in ubiquinone/menaquinone biosynthesis [Hyella patelloides LEGE 07179]